MAERRKIVRLGWSRHQCWSPRSKTSVLMRIKKVKIVAAVLSFKVGDSQCRPTQFNEIVSFAAERRVHPGGGRINISIPGRNRMSIVFGARRSLFRGSRRLGLSDNIVFTEKCNCYTVLTIELFEGELSWQTRSQLWPRMIRPFHGGGIRTCTTTWPSLNAKVC